MIANSLDVNSFCLLLKSVLMYVQVQDCTIRLLSFGATISNSLLAFSQNQGQGLGH